MTVPTQAGLQKINAVYFLEIRPVKPLNICILFDQIIAKELFYVWYIIINSEMIERFRLKLNTVVSAHINL